MKDLAAIYPHKRGIGLAYCELQLTHFLIPIRRMLWIINDVLCFDEMLFSTTGLMTVFCIHQSFAGFPFGHMGQVPAVLTLKQILSLANRNLHDCLASIASSWGT